MVYYAIAFALTMFLSARLGTPQYSPQGVPIKTFQDKKAVWIALMPLILLALFRWNVGADSVYGSSYWQAYHASANGINSRGLEEGFYWFMRIFAGLKIPFFWFLFAHGVVFFAASSYAIYKGSVWGTWSVLLFFLLTVYFDSYSSLRQSLAEAVCMIGWALMGTERRSLKKDISILSLFVVSSLFHLTGLLNIPIYLLSKLRFKRRIDVLILALIAAAMTPVMQEIIPVVMDILSSNNNYTKLGLARINIAVTGLFFFTAWLFYDEIDGGSQHGYMYINQSLYIFILMLNSGAMYLPYRVYDMLRIGYIFIIPQILRNISDKKSRFLIQVGFAGICLALFVNFMLQPGNPYIQYRSAFSDWRNIIHLP